MSSITSIRYEEVKNAIGIIREDCLSNMKNIFNEFNSTMQKIGGQEVFVGEANDSLQSRYNSLKTRFDDFEKLLLRFAQELEVANEMTKQTEQKLSQAAQELNSGN